MTQPVGYMIGNILFLAIGNQYDKTAPSLKYVMCGWHSGIFTNEIFSEQEIKEKYPDVKPVDSLLNIKEIYNQR